MKKWKPLESRQWIGWLIEMVVIVIIFWGISAWQTKDLLLNVPAPDFELTTLDGKMYTLRENNAETILLYFFAPWCSICHLSIHNLEKLHKTKGTRKLSILAIALQWNDLSEIKAFANQHQLTIPVLIGNPNLAALYHINAYPTYYVLDASKHIVKRSVGYSTEIGLRLRT